jgi:hypothetical protein
MNTLQKKELIETEILKGTERLRCNLNNYGKNIAKTQRAQKFFNVLLNNEWGPYFDGINDLIEVIHGDKLSRRVLHADYIPMFSLVSFGDRIDSRPFVFIGYRNTNKKFPTLDIDEKYKYLLDDGLDFIIQDLEFFDPIGLVVHRQLNEMSLFCPKEHFEVKPELGFLKGFMENLDSVTFDIIYKAIRDYREWLKGETIEEVL